MNKRYLKVLNILNLYNYIDKRKRSTGVRLVSYDAIDERAVFI